MRVNFRKLRGLIYKYRYSVAIVFVAVVVAIGTTWYFLSHNNVKFQIPAFTYTKKETRVEAPLTGELVEPVVAGRRAFGVVIENHPDARPQSGYSQADIVYETLAEGGITRTLAIFQSKESEEIGPVRSARPYFIDWTSEYKAIFSHVGGSAEALDLISSLKFPDLNQFSFGNYYWRSASRYAPHNVYTTTAKLQAAATTAGYALDTAPAKRFNFKDDIKLEERPTSQNFYLDFSYDLFRVSYVYNQANNSYARSIAGVAAKDAKTGIQIAPKNVIIQYTDETPYVNYAGAQAMKITTIGTGKGFLFTDGKVQAITWSKASRDALTIFRNAAGEEIKLNKGQTWIEVVPTSMIMSY